MTLDGKTSANGNMHPIEDSDDLDQSEKLLLSIDDELAKNLPSRSATSIESTEKPLNQTGQWEFIRMLRETMPNVGSTATTNETSRGIEAIHNPCTVHTLGRFQLLRLLGCGGCGMVYLAEDPHLGRQVALKVPRPDVLAQPTMRQRFLNEARAAASLDHPNIATVYEVGEFEGIGYFTSMYCKGGSLAEWLSKQSIPLASRTSANLVARLADAVHFAHCRGILHRDIKPSNILLVPRDESEAGGVDGFEWIPKLIDFGLAKVGGEDLTNTGELVGTLRYMAPEMFRNESDARSDVYGLGTTLYELITGHPVHNSIDRLQLIMQVTSGEPTHPRQLNPLIPRDLETIVLKSIESDPSERYQHAGELADDLRRFSNDFPISARPVSQWERGWRWCRRNRVLTTIGTVALAACLATIILTINSVISEFRANQSLRLANETAVRSERSALQSERNAFKSEQRSSEMAALLAWEKGRDLCKASNVGVGLLWMARALEIAPSSAIGFDSAIRADIAGWIGECHLLRQALVHSKRVTVTSFTMDDRYLLTGCDDGVVRAWDLDSGELHYEIAAHSQSITDISFSPDGQKMLTASRDGTARLWDTDSGLPGTLVLRHSPQILSTAWSQKDDLLVTGGSDGTVRCWDRTGRELGEPMVTSGPVLSMDISPDNTTLATAGRNAKNEKGEVLFWSLDSRQKLPIQLDAAKQFRAIAFSPDGQFVLSGDDNWEANLWQSQTGDLVAKLLQDGNASSVDFAPNGQTLMIACQDTSSANLVELRHLLPRRNATAPTIYRISTSNILHRGPMLTARFSHDGRTLGTAGEDCVARIWKRAETRLPERQLILPASAFKVVLDSSHQLAAVADINGQVQLWNLEDGNLEDGNMASGKLSHPRRVNSMFFSTNGQRLVSECSDGILRCWDIQTLSAREIALDSSVESLALSHDGHRFLIDCEDSKMRHIGRDSLESIGPALEHSVGILPVAYSPDGKSFISTTDTGVLAYWDFGGSQFRWMGQHRSRINCVVFNQQGTAVMTGSADGTAVVWDCLTGKRETTFSCSREVTSALFTSNKEFVWLAGFTGEAQLWSVPTAKAVGVAFRHPNLVTSIALSSDESRLLTTCWDAGVRQWRVLPSMKENNRELVANIENQTGLRLTSAGIAEMKPD